MSICITMTLLQKSERDELIMEETWLLYIYIYIYIYIYYYAYNIEGK